MKEASRSVDKLEAFKNILQLEKKQGFKDTAVLRGLDRFLSIWQAELESSPQSRGLYQELNSWDLFSTPYTSMGLPERRRWVEQTLVRLGKVSLPESSTPAVAEGRRSRTVRPTPPGITLESSITIIRGIGPGIASKLKELGVEKVRDLLNFYPRRHVPIILISELASGEEMGIVANVWEVSIVNLGGRNSAQAIVGDESGNIKVVWFNQPFVARSLRVNQRLTITGRLNTFRGERTLEASGYESVENGDELFKPGRMLPIYPATEGLSQRTIRRVVREALDVWIPRMADFLPQEVRERLSLLELGDALSSFHYPLNTSAREEARHRLAFDELFLTQLSLLSRKRDWQQGGSSHPLKADPLLLENFLKSLPFRLTKAQERAVDELLQDVSQNRPMGRLLQGEVGSGKTVVAVAAMMVAAANGYRSVLMAPTEILAEQHFLTVTRLLEGLAKPVKEKGKIVIYIEPLSRPLSIGLLIGSIRKAAKEDVKERIASGEFDIVIGTHALIQEGVEIPQLGLAVVDEQHRFGVMQRQALRGKGQRPHLLVMSATPIPRTLALTLYGDLDISVLDELPQGRKTARTKWVSPYQRETAYQFLRKQIDQGRQAFIICPLIKESEALQVKAATQEFQRLSQEVFSDLRLGLLHGRMRLGEKQEVMERFRQGEVQILVSTPVVEVGVDIPNATVMLIEGADRFGLSELHQFRGRVGRGEHPGYCLLLAEEPSPEAQERLSILERVSDGFKIAEEDLRLRGPGEVFGTRQSGLPDLRLARLSDLPLLKVAREEAQALLERDPHLTMPHHQALAREVGRYAIETVELS